MIIVDIHMYILYAHIICDSKCKIGNLALQISLI